MLLESKCQVLLQNYQLIHQSFKWEHNMMKHFTALIYTQAEKEVNTDLIKETIEEIKMQTNFFSSYRGLFKFMIASLVSVDSTVRLDQLLKCEEILKNAGFKRTQYMPLASHTLCKVTEESNYHKVSQTAFAYYKQMKSKHPFITDGGDYSLAILLARNEIKIDQLDSYYSELNAQKFLKGNNLQLMSHLLALSELPQSKAVTKCAEIRKKLKEEKIKVSPMGYSAIALIALVEDESFSKTYEMMETYHFLKKMKHYKWLDKNLVLLFAASLVLSDILESNHGEVANIAIGISIETIIAAQAAMIATIGAASVAASTHSNA